VRVVVVAEYYPRAADPVLGVWAHRQALAARDAGADVRVVVLHRPVPSRAAVASRSPARIVRPLLQPLRTTLDGIEVTYAPFVAPPRPRSYAAWGAWAAPSLRLALRALHPFDLVHAHYAAPGGDAVRRAKVPYVVSVHGGDILGLLKMPGGERAARAGLEGARLVLANSSGSAERARALGGRDVRVVHLGTDVPAALSEHRYDVVTVGNLVERKRHEDVIAALSRLPGRRYTIVGDGPERARLEALAREARVRTEFLGALGHAEAVAVAQSARVFALPSVDEAFGVAYVEAMAGGVPAIGCAGEPGPEEIARCGGGMTLVPPRDPKALARAIESASDGDAARRTVIEHFTWEACGRATVAAYEAALA
jgi:glycosyltransferase involved in cell wall biosynthesis